MLESLWQEFQNVGDGLVVIQLIAENNSGGTPTTGQMQEWMEDNELTYIVAADPNWSIGIQYNATYNPPTFSIPYYWMIDQERIINHKSSYVNTFRPRIQTLLGAD